MEDVIIMLYVTGDKCLSGVTRGDADAQMNLCFIAAGNTVTVMVTVTVTVTGNL
jgi:hypothetical protein